MVSASAQAGWKAKQWFGSEAVPIALNYTMMLYILSLRNVLQRSYKTMLQKLWFQQLSVMRVLLWNWCLASVVWDLEVNCTDIMKSLICQTDDGLGTTDFRSVLTQMKTFMRFTVTSIASVSLHFVWIMSIVLCYKKLQVMSHRNIFLCLWNTSL